MQLQKKYLLLLGFVLTVNALLAQQPVKVDTTVEYKKIEILQAKRLNFNKLDSSDTDLQSLAGDVIVRQDRTLFYCDSAIINPTTKIMEAFGHVHINDADSIHTYSDYLKYLSKEKKAYLKRNVKLTDGKGILTTSELEYDTQTKIGIYNKGGKVVSGKTTLTSTEAYYYGETRDVYFKKKVVMIDPENKITTDTLLYNTETGVARFVVPTKIINGSRIIKTEDGFYDTKIRKAQFGKRATIVDTAGFSMTADRMAMDDKTGLSEFDGNAVYKNEKEGTNIIAGNIKANRNTNAVLATQKPLMIIKQENDSIYITADTLYSAKLSNLKKSRTVGSIFVRDTLRGSRVIDINKADSSTDRFFEAYYHVKIFQDSLQAVCDSMFYSFQDSTFRLFKNPIVWAKDNQITGDTIYLFTKNKNPDKLYVIDNAMALNKVAANYYNQIKGKLITAFFIAGNIDYLKTKGVPAESIYYGVDDKGNYIGVNKATSDVIDMYFKNRNPQRVVFRNNLQGTTFPMRQVNHEEIRLRGFNWQDAKRPKTKFALFGN